MPDEGDILNNKLSTQSIILGKISADFRDHAGSLGIVAGWGNIEEKLPASETLRSVAVPIWSHQECLDAGYGSHKISENMMCAGFYEGKKDACQVDMCFVIE